MVPNCEKGALDLYDLSSKSIALDTVTAVIVYILKFEAHSDQY